MTRIVLEEHFRPPRGEETEPVKLGETVIYTEQLTLDQLIICKTWKKQYKDRLREEGFDVE